MNSAPGFSAGYGGTEQRHGDKGEVLGLRHGAAAIVTAISQSDGEQVRSIAQLIRNTELTETISE